MGTRRLVLGLVLLSLLGVGLWRLVGERTSSRPRGPAATARVPERAPALESPTHLAPSPTRAEVPAPAPRGSAPPGPSGEPPETATVRIRVLDQEARGVAQAVVQLRSDPGRLPPDLDLALPQGAPHRATTGAGGFALFEGLAAGAYAVSAHADRGFAAGELVVSGAADPDHLLWLVPAPPPFQLRVEDEDGQGVAGAEVRLFGERWDDGLPVREARQEVHGLSDEQGLTEFEGRVYASFVAEAVAPDGRRGQLVAQAPYGWRGPSGALPAVVVRTPGVLTGRLLADPPRSFDGAQVVALAMNPGHAYYTTYWLPFRTPVIEGAYRFDALPAGSYGLLLEDPGGARLDLPPMRFGSELPNSLQPESTTVTSGETTTKDLLVAPGGTLRGRVQEAEGVPLANALVRLTLAPRSSNFPDGFTLHGVHVWRLDYRTGARGEHPEPHRRLLTDPAGRYEFSGLHPGNWRVEVSAPGRVLDRREAVRIEAPGLTELEHRLPRAGALHGIAPPGTYFGLLDVGGRPVQIEVLPASRYFAFAGLAPGEYTFAFFHSSEEAGWIELGSATVVPGETRWCDLRGTDLPVKLRGTVYDRHGPRAGLTVVTPSLRTVTDEAGRFELQSAYPWGKSVSLRVWHEGAESLFELDTDGVSDADWTRHLRLGDHALDVRTLDAAGRPARAALNLRGERAVLREQWTDSSGRRSFHNLGAGAYELQATFENEAELTLAFSLPLDGPLELRAPPSGTLLIEAVDEAGRPRADWRVVVDHWAGAGPFPDGPTAEQARESLRRVADGPTDRDGYARFPGLPTGELEVGPGEEGWAGKRPEWPRTLRTDLAPDEVKTLRFVIPREQGR